MVSLFLNKDNEKMRIQYWIVIFLFILLTSCATMPPPKHTHNICSIFNQYPDWKYYTKRTQKKWKVPVEVQMAIMYQESSFIADAKPPREMILGIIPWARPTSAYGYSQAIDHTWRLYQRSMGHYDANRHDFADADDFIGWYASRASLRAGIPPYDAYALYLAYHEGITNYNHKSYYLKPWLMRVAKRVQARAAMYRKQLLGCWYKSQRIR
jgi:hypothetical protein